MRVLTSKDGNLISQFDNIKEGNKDADFDSTSSKAKLIKNQEPDADKGKIKHNYNSNTFLDFVNHLKK